MTSFKLVINAIITFKNYIKDLRYSVLDADRQFKPSNSYFVYNIFKEDFYTTILTCSCFTLMSMKLLPDLDFYHVPLINQAEAEILKIFTHCK